MLYESFFAIRYEIYSSKRVFNSLANDVFLDWSKLKAFADDKSYVTEKLKFVLEKVENIVGKGENAGNHNVFKRILFRVVNVGTIW